MESCPSCFQNVEILESHYGTLFNCPHCNAVFFIGWDGKPEVASHTANKIEAPAPEVSASIDSGFEPQSVETPVNNFSAMPEIQPEIQPESQSISEVAPDQLKPNPFQDVVDFGNSTNLEGVLRYTLKIQGIDHSTILEQVKDQLDDSRLGWKIEDVLSQIQNGELVLSDLNTAKASVIVQRLKHLPVQISWKQILATI